MKLTQKQETFCLNLFQGMSQHEAYLKAGYSNKQSPAVIDKNASILAKTGKVLVRIDELRKKAEDDSVMDVLERKQRLTEIARAKLTDFMELGQDSAWVNIGPETKNGGAISEIHSRTEYDDDGAKPTVHTSVKLHNPIEAIKELNKMDKVYDTGTTVNVDNRQIILKVVYDNANSNRIPSNTTPASSSPG